MTLLLICIALVVGLIIGATEANRVLNALSVVEVNIHERLKAIEEKLQEKL